MDDGSMGLTGRERAMLAALPRYRVGSAALEDRVVGALMRRGLLQRTVVAFGRAPWRVLTQLAAAAAVFLMGALLWRTSQATEVPGASGMLANGSHATSAQATPGTASLAGDARDTILALAVASAPVVRRMGTAYAGALIMLPADTVESLARIARDFARFTVRAAGLQLARTHEDTMMVLARTALPAPAIAR
jgi:hypothetical protein